MAKAVIETADCLDYMRAMESDSVDLVLTSPPYEAARTYGIDFALKGQAWVDWSVARYLECVRISRGLVAWVVEGQTRQFRWSATPAILMADLHRAGVKLRKPPVFHRVGIPGSGGPDWLRNDWEFIVCSSKGKLPWSDNTAMGHPPKWAPGGTMSYRNMFGERVNGKPAPGMCDKGGNRRRTGDGKRELMGSASRKKVTPSEHAHTNGDDGNGSYAPPKLANPGNVLKFIVGGGVMGSPLCHENEAPFPESFAEFFVLSFCPPGGTVCDPFSGSGTTAAVALKNDRNFIGCDIRESQVELTKRRIAEVQRQFV